MPYLGRREANGSCSTMQAGSSRFLYRIGIELYSVVCTQLQTCHYAPAHIVTVGMVEPKVRAPTLGPVQRGKGKNASEQREIAYRECTLKLFAPYFV